MSVKWVFFDVGDVLFDEDAQHLYYAHSLLLAMRRNGIDVTWDAYHAQVLECVRTNPGTALIEAGRVFVPDAGQWDKIFHEGRAEYEAMRKPRPYGQLLDGMERVLRDLHGEFRLGVIANQHPPVVQAFADYGIAPLLDVVAIDEVVGVSKPDPAIFRWALNNAGCAPNEAIMVGDRPDVDIAPARQVGLGTVRFQRGILYTHYDPRQPDEFADVVVRSVCDLPAAIRKRAAASANPA